jgi:hypothetical protein
MIQGSSFRCLVFEQHLSRCFSTRSRGCWRPTSLFPVVRVYSPSSRLYFVLTTNTDATALLSHCMPRNNNRRCCLRRSSVERRRELSSQTTILNGSFCVSSLVTLDGYGVSQSSLATNGSLPVPVTESSRYVRTFPFNFVANHVPDSDALFRFGTLLRESSNSLLLVTYLPFVGLPSARGILIFSLVAKTRFVVSSRLAYFWKGLPTSFYLRFICPTDGQMLGPGGEQGHQTLPRSSVWRLLAQPSSNTRRTRNCGSG